MNLNRPTAYYLLLLSFPVSYVLHTLNENFGLIHFGVIARLLPVYLLITLGIAAASKRVFKHYASALVFAFVLLTVYFLFGVFKDFTESRPYLQNIFRYSVSLSLLVAGMGLFAFYLKRTPLQLARLSKAISVFLVANLVLETAWFLYNEASGARQQQDFGDPYHTQIKGYQPLKTARKPVVFWLVFDEYAASSTLKRVWQFSNPLDSMLRSRGFFVSDSARSNYNFTPYSITSELDMTYLNGLYNHSIVRARDMARGAHAIYDNNTVRILEQTGYGIRNYTIFSFSNHSSLGLDPLGYVPASLMNFQTLGGRLQQDIGWNFNHLFAADKKKAGRQDEAEALLALDKDYDALISNCLREIREGKNEQKPMCFMFHFMFPHEPFLYNKDGTVATDKGVNASKENYIEQLQYTNTVIRTVADSILEQYRNKDIVIIIQGDHGYKFDETDPLYDAESCRTLYAVYCTDKDYSPWNNNMTLVNSFRIVFNKYFHTQFPLLKDTAFCLYYR